MHEDYFNLTTDILHIINSSTTMEKTIRELLLLIKKFTRMEAVGIRLKEGSDFPYYVAEGFPDYFIKAENFLCAYDQYGELMRDSNGNPYLECMCGNIICGRTNPDFDFFTEFGSFYSNNTSKLLSATTEEDRQARTRNRCNSEGYETVVLIPIKHKTEIIGLLQLNDKKINSMTETMVKNLEQVGYLIGLAFYQTRAEDEFKKISGRLETRLKESNCLYTISDLAATPDISMDNFFQQLVKIIPGIWKNNKNVAAKLTIFNKSYISPNYHENMIEFFIPLKLRNNEIGSMIIAHEMNTEESPGDFTINNHRAIINNICSRIANFIQSYNGGNTIVTSNNELESKLKNRMIELEKLNNELQKTVDEKEMLVKEVYHRIKDNLNIINSLLWLQMENLDNNHEKDILRDCKNRIMSMSAIHDMLYKSSDLLNINLHNYIHVLADQLMDTYSLDDDSKLTTNISVPDILVTPKQVTSLALILNEIISNSFKHAFPDINTNGTITIKGVINENTLLLIVKDNGIGLPIGIDINNTRTLGMQIITVLVSQLNGTVALTPGNGTEYLITFPIA